MSHYYTRMICAICGFAKADIYFLPLVCVSGQQHIGVCTLFCLPCSHVPEQRITHGGAAKHISGSCVFGSSFYADQSCLMPAESMGMGSECGSGTWKPHCCPPSLHPAPRCLRLHRKSQTINLPLSITFMYRS